MVSITEEGQRQAGETSQTGAPPPPPAAPNTDNPPPSTSSAPNPTQPAADNSSASSSADNSSASADKGPPPPATGYPAQPVYGAPPPYAAPPPPYGYPPPPHCRRGHFHGQGAYAVYLQEPILPGHFSPQAFPGLKIMPPRRRPHPGEVIIGYEAGEADVGCCVCDTLNPMGWLFALAWAFVCWPFAFTVCLCPAFHEIVQRPVYGDPSFVSAPAPCPPPTMTVIFD